MCWSCWSGEGQDGIYSTQGGINCYLASSIVKKKIGHEIDSRIAKFYLLIDGR